MNAAVNNGQNGPQAADEPPLQVAMRALVAEYGVLRVLVGALRQMRPAPRQVSPYDLSAHLRRDIGLPPDDGPDYGRFDGRGRFL